MSAGEESPEASVTASPNSARHTTYLIFICIVAGMGGFLFGFDSIVISGALPDLKRQFALSSGTEGLFVSASLIGCMLASPFAGIVSDRWGRRNLLFAAALLTSFATLICAAAHRTDALIGSRLICGLGVGSASMVCPLYITEVSPQAMRGRLVTIYQFAITIGICISLLSNSLIERLAMHAYPPGIWLSFAHNEAWRLMIGSQLIPSVAFLILSLFIPESPRWLIRVGRDAKAFDVLAKINSRQAAASTFDEVREAARRERLELGATRYRHIWSAPYRKPLLMALFLGVVSEFSGITVVFYYGPAILHAQGYELGGALNGFVVIGMVNMLTTVIALWLVDRVGRRPLLLVGTMGAMVCLIAISACLAQVHSSGGLIVTAICGFVAFYAFSIGPIKFIVAAEIFPTALRARAVATFIFAVFAAGAIVNQLFPLARDAWGVPAAFLVFAMILLPQVVFAWRFMPETAGRTLEQLAELWVTPKTVAAGARPSEQAWGSLSNTQDTEG
jgi:SP family arabinose:H+ symporter-like MFS transporter